MPASVTLTVAHLPTSTSFFLSALQPLDYAYRGRSDNTIGFGSTTNPSAPADFWITQEIPGVPAGAAHVAFQAASRGAVQQFFNAALKAGGKFHGEPQVRDGGGYYSAAIIDFDGNSIEAVFRPTCSDNKENDVTSIISSKTLTKPPSDIQSQVSRAAPSEVKSFVSRSAPASEVPTPARSKSGDLIEGIVSEARSAAGVALQLAQSIKGSQPAQSPPSANNESSTIMGTLLGVAAGAALHYAFTQEKNSNSRPSSTGRSITEPGTLAHYQPYDHTEAPHYLALEDNDYASTTRPRSTTSTHRVSTGGQIIYSTGFGNGSNPSPTTISKATSHQGPKLLEAPPPSSSSPFKGSPSHVSHSSSYHTKAPSLVPSAAPSRPSTARHQSERTPPYPTAETRSPSLATTRTTKTKTHHILRTSSDSQVHHITSPPPPPPSSTASKRAPLSEANLARAAAVPAPVSSVSIPNPSAPSVSLHSKREEPEAYPIHLRSRTGRSKAASKVDGEVRPEDSVSQVSSVKSFRSASTIRMRRGA